MLAPAIGPVNVGYLAVRCSVHTRPARCERGAAAGRACWGVRAARGLG